MPRLRTTTLLSMLALLIAIGGTGWLSGLTSPWRDAAEHAATPRQVRSTAPDRRPPPRLRDAHAPAATGRGWYVATAAEPVAQAAANATPEDLRPLATPEDTSQSWDQLRGHLDGLVTVRVQVDAAGRVEDARVIDSSGDPILDRHALRSVQGWRFAVPPGHPHGFSAELPMRFSSQARALGVL